MIVDLHQPDAADAFTAAMTATGLAVLTEHGLAPSRTAEVYAEWQRFFDSGAAQAYLAGSRGDGYFPVPSGSPGERDEKEFFHLSPRGLSPREVSAAARDHLHEGIALARVLLGWLDERLLGGSRGLSQLIDGATATVLRIQQYRPGREVTDQRGRVRALPHTDIDLLTLMPAPNGPGFELFLDGAWTPVDAPEGSLIVQAGEMLELVSQGRVTAALHRVVFDSGAGRGARMSLPLFVHPRDDEPLRDGITAADFRADRLAQMRADGWQPVLGGPIGREGE